MSEEEEIEFSKQEFKRWISDNGDSTLRLNYNLNENSTVIDAGGYVGDWTEKIYEKYKCNIIVFEPIKGFYNSINERLSGNDKIKIYNFGVSKSDCEMNINISKDSSSVFKSGSNTEKIKLINFCNFIESENLKKIDLIKVNIEGGEYDLMESIIEGGKQDLIDNFQIQFHDMFPEAKERRIKIREELSKTHHITYDYHFIWENWRKNE